MKHNVYLFSGLGADERVFARIATEMLIIVSSVQHAEEIPHIYKGKLARLALRLTPDSLLNKPNFILNYMFSIQTSAGRNTLREVVSDSDPAFVCWAIAYLQEWQQPNLASVKQFHRIHGANDRIFPNVYQSKM